MTTVSEAAGRGSRFKLPVQSRGPDARENLALKAAGQGFEPQLPGPEPGVLPLDDPATAGGVYRERYGAFGSPKSSRYTGTSLFSASVSMRATTSTYGSRPDPRSFALSSPSTW